MKPVGVVTLPSAWRLQPSLSPTRLSGVSTSSLNFAASLEHRLDEIGRGVGKARQIAVAIDVEHIVEKKHHVIDGRFIGRHVALPAVRWSAERRRPDRNL